LSDPGFKVDVSQSTKISEPGAEGFFIVHKPAA
jgi:hypothetical protein